MNLSNYWANFYSIMIDSTPDISHQEMYTIVIRYTNNFNVKERLITAAELLKKFNISTDDLIAQCYDSASNMSDVNKGVQTCISNKLRREIIFIPCSVHSSNLLNNPKASFTWSTSQSIQLIGIDLNLTSGSLVGIIGAIGSSKSSLLA
ncbi:unnamed protein product, partial [Adineta steineri]